jgi:hypothetical protein
MSVTRKPPRPAGLTARARLGTRSRSTCRPERPDQRFEVGTDLVELAEQLVHGGELGRYLVKTVFNRGKSSQHVVSSTAHRLADRIRAHDVLTRCAVRVGLTWVVVVR